MYLSREIVNISLPACPVSSTSTRVVLTHYLHTQVPFPEKETDESCHKQLRRWARTALVLVLVQCYVCCIRTPKAKVILLPEEAYVPNLLYSFVDCLSQPWSFCTNEELKSFKYILLNNSHFMGFACEQTECFVQKYRICHIQILWLERFCKFIIPTTSYTWLTKV